MTQYPILKTKSNFVLNTNFHEIVIRRMQQEFTMIYEISSGSGLVLYIIKTHVHVFCDTDLHEVSWHLANRAAITPSRF